MSKESVLHYAYAFIAAKRGRAAVRSSLSRLRKSWLDAHDEYYEYGDQYMRNWWGDDEYALSAKIEGALRDRAAANAHYRRVLSKLDRQFGKEIIWQPPESEVKHP